MTINYTANEIAIRGAISVLDPDVQAKIFDAKDRIKAITDEFDEACIALALVGAEIERELG